MGSAYGDIAPARQARAVTPHDTNVLTGGACRSLYIGVTGDVVLIPAGGSAAVTFKAVPVGVLTVQAQVIKSTGTTATDIVALY